MYVAQSPAGHSKVGRATLEAGAGQGRGRVSPPLALCGVERPRGRRGRSVCSRQARGWSQRRRAPPWGPAACPRTQDGHGRAKHRKAARHRDGAVRRPLPRVRMTTRARPRGTSTRALRAAAAACASAGARVRNPLRGERSRQARASARPPPAADLASRPVRVRLCRAMQAVQKL